MNVQQLRKLRRVEYSFEVVGRSKKGEHHSRNRQGQPCVETVVPYSLRRIGQEGAECPRTYPGLIYVSIHELCETLGR